MFCFSVLVLLVFAWLSVGVFDVRVVGVRTQDAVVLGSAASAAGPNSSSGSEVVGIAASRAWRQ